MEHTLEEKKDAFARLLQVMDELRLKCPWDSKQTFDSLRTLTIEEVYELSNAISEKDFQDVKKELGDVLLHIVFYSLIASENQLFDIKDVCDAICEKLIYRHPHIFSDVKVSSATEVEQNWEQLKLKEKGGNKRVLQGVPDALPALVKAYRIQDKARSAGFDWDRREQVWAKVKEEIQEFQSEVEKTDMEKMEAEFGDLFFSLVNAARLYDINPENALERTNKKFISRFNYLENKAKELDRPLKSLSLEEMDEIWEESKKEF
ncbi:MAG: nucleoside triphosphate pyrophosphohydrolase [Paludibacteraceae bacterium]|nr:nucleoside triphosphate pyrophosphohydrolase [Paludibacteraceae bacterium]MBO7316960.1 nucleoside triphosphate pyrophosphohydrolase [Paludibacteraceae bacterium]